MAMLALHDQTGGAVYPTATPLMCDKSFALDVPTDPGIVHRFEERLQCLLHIPACLFDGVALTCNVQFGALSNLVVALAVGDGHKLAEVVSSNAPTVCQLLPRKHHPAPFLNRSQRS